MNWLAKAALLVVVVAPLTRAQNGPSCDPSTPLDKQKRTEMKHRKAASQGTNVTTTTVAEILGWDQPDDLANRDVRNSNSSIDPREEDVFEFEADLWRIAQEANDCDYHLELTMPGKPKTADRVIVEIPNDQGYSSARQAVLESLAPADRDTLNSQGEVVLKNPVRLKLTGYAFFDAFHYTSRYDPAKPGTCKFTKAQKLQRGNNHGTCAVGTLWELHPVWKAVPVT